jgi:hypothetical protein
MTETLISATRAILEERTRINDKPASNIETSMFAEECRRMQKYDSEICPSNHQALISYVKENGCDATETLKRLGKLTWTYPKNKIINYIKIVNNLLELNKTLPETERLTLKRNSYDLFLPQESHATKDLDLLVNEKKVRIKDERTCLFTLEEHLEGFDLIYSDIDLPMTFVASRYNSSNNISRRIYGRSNIRSINSYDKSIEEVYILGKLSLDEDLPSVLERRFTYIFGIAPVTDNEIKQALILLNKFPTVTEDGRDHIEYSLKERPLKELHPSRAVNLIYDEAKEMCGSKGLFSDIRAYEIIGKKMPKRDPVLVAFDHFGNRYPLIYWNGDSGLPLKDKPNL